VKRMFKVLSPIPKKDGGTWWMRLGSAFTNKDDSINVYLDAIPKDGKFQLRELDESDLREREGRRSPSPVANPLPPVTSTTDVPF
jgi:hypothetical protein